MSLARGTRLGPYEIRAFIGAGGMGEVYQARDTRLDRTVAIKTLPASVASDPDRKQRFDLEARSVAALNHPHICTLHDLGEQGGIHFLVMEYLEGETLAQRLEKGPLPLDRALQVAIEIADALDQAHRHRVVHRDLKPGNIMLTTTGAKLLDFGLATLRPGEQTASVSGVPTRSANLTDKGSIIGTLPYMAPEQLEGREADARSDLFAFGAVMFEMLTGQRAFEGRTQAALIHAILGVVPPPVSSIQLSAPPALDHVVGTCLQRDPDQRFHSAHDVMMDLRWIAGAPSHARDMTPRRGGRAGTVWTALAATMVASFGTGVVVWWLSGAAGPAGPVARFALTLPVGQAFSASGQRLVALSPDGRRLAYVADQRLNLRRLDDLEPMPVQGTGGTPQMHGRSPVFSPDGEWIAFWQEGQLRKVAVSGGAAVPLCDVPWPDGPSAISWSDDDTLLYSGFEGIWRVSSRGGTPVRLIATDKDEFAHGPQLLPGGQAVLYTAGSPRAWDDGDIVVQSVAGGDRRVLIRRGRDARYVSTGHLVYGRDRRVFAVQFDHRRLQVTGDPVALLEGVLDGGIATGASHFALSSDGTLVYVPAPSATVVARTLLWVDRSGREELVTAPARPYSWVRVSPEGSRLVMEVQEWDNTDVWTLDLVRGTQTRLTFAAEADRFPVWTPDGGRVVFASGSDLVWKAADGTGEAERLATGLDRPRPFAWARAPERLIFDVGSLQADIMALSIDGDPRVEPIIADPFPTFRPAVSPDGRWLAYTSLESGGPEVYLRPFPDVTSLRLQVSAGGGNSPVWSPDGRELFYQSGDVLMRVATALGTTAEVETPEPMIRGDYYWGTPDVARPFDIAPDGQRFLMVKEHAAAAAEPPPQMILVQHWFEELRQRVPGP